MIHLDILLYFISFIAATASITGCILFYFHYHKEVLIYYGLMLVVATLLLFHRVLELYCVLNVHSHCSALSYIVPSIEKIGFALGIFIGPLFMHQLLGIALSRTRKIVYIAIGTLFSILAIAEIATRGMPLAAILKNIFCMPLLFGTYCYCLLIGALSLKKLASPFLKNVVLALFIISVAILPFSLYQYFSQKPFLPGFTERPVLFIALFIFTLYFSSTYFSHPAYLSNQKLTDYFKKKFSITERESEIILHAIKGDSNQAIAEKLFISSRTVESHLYSIFQKLGIKNRVQLTNVIQTNRA